MERKVITATNGIVFTDGTNYAKKLFLSEDADASKWYEITQEQYDEIMAEQEEYTQRT